MAAASVERRKRSSAGAKILSVKEQRKAFSKAWLAFLRMPLPIDMYKTVRPVPRAAVALIG
jgi:hypothetical protein